MPAATDFPLQCTFDADDWRRLSRHWYPIAASSEVGEQPFSATLLDQPLVAYRVAGELVVARDVCAHRGVPLSLGKADGQGVVCRYHGLRYGAGGPVQPRAIQPERAHPLDCDWRSIRASRGLG